MHGGGGKTAERFVSMYLVNIVALKEERDHFRNGDDGGLVEATVKVCKPNRNKTPCRSVRIVPKLKQFVYFRREHGLEALYQAFERCVGVLSASSVETDVAVDVCTHIIRCYSVAAQFQVHIILILIDSVGIVLFSPDPRRSALNGLFHQIIIAWK
jgi:hypothetical protein